MKNNYIKAARMGALFLFVVAGIVINVGTGPIKIDPEEGWNEMSSDQFFTLGYHENAFKFNREIFIGKNVRSFKLKLKARPLIGTDTGWITGMQVKVYTMPGNVYRQTINWLQTQDPEGGFWTDTIHGNWARLEISTVPSGNHIPVGEHGSYLYIEKVKYNWDSSISRSFVPSSNIGQLNQTNMADATHISSLNEGRTVGLLVGPNGTQYHYATLAANRRYAVYVSPYSPALENDVGLAVGISTSGFVNIPFDTARVAGEVRPEARDTGVYYEIAPAPYSRTLYLTVRGVAGHSYTLAVNRVKRRFPIVYEMSDGLYNNDAPILSRDQFAGSINVINPFGVQHADFVRRSATYLQRTREMIVLTSAHMLAASEGYARQNQADIYESEHTFLNTDVFLHQINGRAYASLTKVNLFLEELDNPVHGGSTMHHEWGHFEYGMDDEYHEDSGCCTTIDHNSVMGTHRGSNIPRFEFCTSFNHVWRSNWDPTEADDESNWEIFTDKYDLSTRHNFAQGQYHDVLHALEDLIEFNYYE